jgi:hypothetical protein
MGKIVWIVKSHSYRKRFNSLIEAMDYLYKMKEQKAKCYSQIQ